MRFWWVNHNQTFEDEVYGGYLWSPKRNKNNARNPFYDYMLEAEVGDFVISYAKGHVQAIGVVQDKASEMANPFKGAVASNWNEIGWVLPVEFEFLKNPVHTKSFASELSPLLPETHSPLQNDGSGHQRYLTQISSILFNRIVEISKAPILKIKSDLMPARSVVSELEVELEAATREFSGDLVKIELVKARRGQGFFKMQLRRFEHACRITGVTDHKLLIASHIKPWRASTDFEKLDGNNGFLLSPHVDKLFDKCLISFENNGNLIVSDNLDRDVLDKWNISSGFNAGPMRDEQIPYLEEHRRRLYEDS
jgi:putative restriction endonuclease